MSDKYINPWWLWREHQSFSTRAPWTLWAGAVRDYRLHWRTFSSILPLPTTTPPPKLWLPKMSPGMAKCLWKTKLLPVRATALDVVLLCSATLRRHRHVKWTAYFVPQLSQKMRDLKLDHIKPQPVSLLTNLLVKYGMLQDLVRHLCAWAMLISASFQFHSTCCRSEHNTSVQVC